MARRGRAAIAGGWCGAGRRGGERANRRSRRCPKATSTDTGEALDRARALERLSAALVALDEPFRTTVIRRYLDGESAAAIARSLGVPAGTVRWRLSTGLARLRAALDDSAPRWRYALIPLVPRGGALAKGLLLVKLQTKIAIVVVVLLSAAGALWWGRRGSTDAPAQAAQRSATVPMPAARAATAQPVRNPLPGQGRALVSREAAPGGIVAGRVINWSSGAGVVGAELTFTGAGTAQTVRTSDDGAFELAPPAPGTFDLAAVGATGFLPYAPELQHSPVHLTLAKDQVVRGITVFLFPALDYHGHVVDAAGAAVAGAHVRLLGSPTGEQVIDHGDTEWTSGADGGFTFHAADDAVLEAEHAGKHGWAKLDGNVAITKQLTIALGDAPAHDATITGRVLDANDSTPLADVQVRAMPVLGAPTDARATVFTTSAGDGSFTIEHVDRGSYTLSAETEDAGVTRIVTTGGATDVVIPVDKGVTISGAVVTKVGDPVPAFTVTAYRREGAARGLEAARSIVDPSGRFAIHVRRGELDLEAWASGWAPAEPVRIAASASVHDVKLVLAAGGVLQGVVVDAVSGAGIAYARVMREGRGGGASATPANAGTVTRPDGSFELTGLPSGPLSITIGADSYHPRISSGFAISEGATTGPVSIALTPLLPGELPTLELVGIGVQLTADSDALRVARVIAGSGAEAAGIVVGDRIVAVEGQAAADLGVDGAVARIRGEAGTTVQLTLDRGGEQVQLAVERRKLKA